MLDHFFLSFSTAVLSIPLSLDITYFKRFRMEINLVGRTFPRGPLPRPYRLLPWDDSRLDAFAQAKFQSFQGELDTRVFPSLGSFEGCRRLMTDIVRRPGFLPEATWLLVYDPSGDEPLEYCGTIQGIRDKSGSGAIQNIGVTPAHRGRGLGTFLIHRSLDGFRRSGIFLAHLEVTAQNEKAIQLYRRLGFVTVKTLYKTVSDDDK